VLLFVCITQAHSTERQLDAHAHGYGELNVAIEGGTVTLELDTPAFNIVGFEHPPETDEDKATIKNAVSKLNNGSELFLFPADAECRLVDTYIVSSLIDQQHSAHKDHDSGHKDHDSGHKDHDSGHKDHDHKSSKNEDHASNDIHSEFQANYKFQCDAIMKANTIEVMIFKLFPNTRQLDVQTILPNGQSAMQLIPSSTLLSF
jgi:hypothetical protein